MKKGCIIYLLRAIARDTREWRNWQTRTFEGRVVHTVRVQVPFPAPKGKGRQQSALAFLHGKRVNDPYRHKVAVRSFLPQAKMNSERSERCSTSRFRGRMSALAFLRGKRVNDPYRHEVGRSSERSERCSTVPFPRGNSLDVILKISCTALDKNYLF